MATKILAAKICAGNGCATIITNSNKNNQSAILVKKLTIFILNFYKLIQKEMVIKSFKTIRIDYY